MTVVCLSAAAKPNRVAEGPHTASASRTIELKPKPSLLLLVQCSSFLINAVRDLVNLPYIEFEESQHWAYQPVDLERSTLIFL